MQKLNFPCKYHEFFTCTCSSWEHFLTATQCGAEDLSVLSSVWWLSCRMVLKAAQFSQQSPPRVQVHHLENMSQQFWRRAWEPKFVSDPGPPAGSVTARCPATRMDKVILHSLCYSKIEQELYLKQESDTLRFRKLTGQESSSAL